LHEISFIVDNFVDKSAGRGAAGAGAYTLSRVLEIDRIRLTSRVLVAMRDMTPTQRVDFVEKVLHADPVLRPVLPQLLVACARARRADRVAPLVRDSVS
jgi:hypothetical protein